jgi:peptidoglycan/xylan/chitin deacetylase (PgdA/CDA1 family)
LFNKYKYNYRQVFLIPWTLPHYTHIMAGLKALAASLLLSAVTFATPLPTVEVEKRQSSVPVGTVITSCTVAGTAALTFDDGPYIYTEQLLDILQSNGVHATFFQNGQNYDNIYNYASTIQRIVDEGHQIGSHTYDISPDPNPQRP